MTDIALSDQNLFPSGDGHNRTNIVFHTQGGWFDSMLVLPANDPSPIGTPAGTRLVMTFDDNASPGVPRRGMQLAVSQDGFNFTRLSPPPRLPESFADTSVALVLDPTSNTFVAYGREDGYPDQHPGVKCGNVTPGFNMQSVRGVRRAASAPVAAQGHVGPKAVGTPAVAAATMYSLTNFTINVSAANPLGTVFGFDRLDAQCVDVYNTAAITYNSYTAPLLRASDVANVPVSMALTTTAYVAFPSVFQHFGDAENDGVLDVRLIFSRDGIAFRYVGGDRGAWVPRGPGSRGVSQSMFNATEAGGFPAAWDAGLTYMFRGAIALDSETTLALHYFGMQGSHKWTGAARASGGRYGVGRVTFRRDGFASFGCDRPALDRVTNATRPLVARTRAVTLPDPRACPGSSGLGLWLNVAASVGGNLTVEVQDAATGLPALPLLTHANSAGFAGDHLRAAAVWWPPGLPHSAHVPASMLPTPLDALGGVGGRPVRLEFSFHPPARIYAWQFGCMVAM